MQGNLFSDFSKEEHENVVREEASQFREATIEEEDIDYYCKQFEDFMQAQPQCKYNLRSSKERSREPEQ